MLLEFGIYFLQAKFKGVFPSEYVEIMLDLYSVCKKRTLPQQGSLYCNFRSRKKQITKGYDLVDMYQTCLN